MHTDQLPAPALAQGLAFKSGSHTHVSSALHVQSDCELICQRRKGALDWTSCDAFKIANKDRAILGVFAPHRHQLSLAAPDMQPVSPIYVKSSTYM